VVRTPFEGIEALEALRPAVQRQVVYMVVGGESVVADYGQRQDVFGGGRGTVRSRTVQGTVLYYCNAALQRLRPMLLIPALTPPLDSTRGLAQDTVSSSFRPSGTEAVLLV
jgi:hypothetical protein